MRAKRSWWSKDASDAGDWRRISLQRSRTKEVSKGDGEMDSAKKALVLAGGLPQIRLMHELSSRGYEVLLADYSDHPIAEPYADRFFRESTLDLNAIRRIATDESVELVTTCCTDQALNTVAQISSELGLPCYIDAETGLSVTNKTLMKRIFRISGVPTANFAIVGDGEGVSNVAYPCVVKPADCNSSKGVIRANSPDERNAAIEVARSLSRTGSALIEEYLEGPEFSVDAFVCNGRADVLCISRSDKIPNEKAFVIQRSVYERSEFERLRSRVEQIVQDIADAFNLINCPMLVQLIENNGELIVLEFSARTGGCTKFWMIEQACGIDVIREMLDATLGEALDIQPKRRCEVVVDEFIYCHEGTFGSLSGFVECKRDGLIKEFHELHASGAILGPPNTSGDRAAAMTIVASSLAEYRSKHQKIGCRIGVRNTFGEDIMRHDLYDKMDRAV